MKISFDLDETLFVNPAEVPTEPELKFPYNKLYRDRLRKGAVELLKEINESDTELWIYTTSNRSLRYIRGIFGHYGIRIDSIVNAPRHEAEVARGRSNFPSKYPSVYRIDLHVDDEKSVYENGIAYGFRVYRITNDDADWADNIRRELERIRRGKSENDGQTDR
ncbi:MAG: HAD family hydrolase [Ruminococcus sp.]|nr:HAD family hydrolase [Ruminococcus sp.]